MRTISATQAKQEFAALLDVAQHEPVLIRRQKRDVAVLLSMRDFEALRAYRLEELRQHSERVGARAVAAGLTEDKLAALLADER
ncbi:type II toxin-antitoxin system Phd/YefM family antitoxin [Ferrovibrio sp.]|uniref:type II toxin-antitoxin system Phd/YefM family antitoxin n=1 Tax=Ferrovibrio sp. TaxID=1917215 RepID=UPI001B66A1FF|nr:type II toxin-antitoxin system Phd/YefM family antitoxin [Ferrovibrio sp.]MBP7063549.1 type II toxin-antitoxin system Phd/YefM family antitoxin [Ferrovibrio sp.]